MKNFFNNREVIADSLIANMDSLIVLGGRKEVRAGER